MKRIRVSFDEMTASVPKEIGAETELSFAIAAKIDRLIKARGMSKKDFAEAIRCRPSEVTKWLSGQHNFTIRTLARIGSFFDEPIISVTKHRSI